MDGNIEKDKKKKDSYRDYRCAKRASAFKVTQSCQVEHVQGLKHLIDIFGGPVPVSDTSIILDGRQY